jgi:DNA-binding NarL/FixJ family response regulator
MGNAGNRQRKGAAALSGADLSGQNVFAPEEWQTLTEALDLSPRESSVVRSVFDGASERAIAEQLGLSPHTVHTYLWRIYRKLQVRSREQLLVRIFAEFRSLF